MNSHLLLAFPPTKLPSAALVLKHRLLPPLSPRTFVNGLWHRLPHIKLPGNLVTHSKPSSLGQSMSLEPESLVAHIAPYNAVASNDASALASHSPTAESHESNQTDRFLAQYVVIRKDLVESLKWPLGSVLTQACHAAVAAVWIYKDDPDTLKYCDDIDNMTTSYVKKQQPDEYSDTIYLQTHIPFLWQTLPFHVANTAAWKNVVSLITKVGGYMGLAYYGPNIKMWERKGLKEMIECVSHVLEPNHPSWTKYEYSTIFDG